jgi:membrane protease YdiL (CAAX protease family)
LESVAAACVVAATLRFAPNLWVPVALLWPLSLTLLRRERLASLAGPLEPLRALRHAGLVLACTLPIWGLGAVLALRFQVASVYPFVLEPNDGLRLLALSLVEEFFFRGYLQPLLERDTTRRWNVLGVQVGPGWVFTAIAFGLAHLQDGPLAAASRVIPGLVFGHCRAATGSIWAGWLVHLGYNLAGSTLRF